MDDAVNSGAPAVGGEAPAPVDPDAQLAVAPVGPTSPPDAAPTPPDEPASADADVAPVAEASAAGKETNVAEEASDTEAPPPSPTPDSALLRKHFTAPALIPLERLSDDETFFLRESVGDVSALATDIARLGQLYPIDLRLLPPDRFQVVTGFRRVAALKLLQREKVAARLHADLSDADALLMALAAGLHGRTVEREALEAARARLEAEGRLTPAARDMLAKALDDDGPGPEEVEEEVDADELAADVTLRLGQCNQDLSLLADVFGDLEPQRRADLLTQLKYSVDLVAFLEGKAGS